MILAAILAAGVTVELPMEAHVRGLDLTLGDVATITGDDPAEVDAISGVYLGYAPAPGYSRLLRANQIDSILRRASNVRYSLGGNAAVRVWPEVETLAGDALRQEARAALDPLLVDKDVQIEAAGDLIGIEVPHGEEAAQLQARPPMGEIVSGRLSVPVDVLVDGAVYRTVWTTWELEVWESLPVLRRDVASGERLSPSLFEVRRVRRGSAGRGKALTEAMVVGALAARNLSEGSIVTDVDVHRPTVVTLGDAIYLEVRRGSVVARVQAVAQESGSIGDRIRVLAGAQRVPLSGLIRSAELIVLDMDSVR